MCIWYIILICNANKICQFTFDALIVVNKKAHESKGNLWMITLQSTLWCFYDFPQRIWMEKSRGFSIRAIICDIWTETSDEFEDESAIDLRSVVCIVWLITADTVCTGQKSWEMLFIGELPVCGCSSKSFNPLIEQPRLFTQSASSCSW